jgi:heat-inducible transcriptional repressor
MVDNLNPRALEILCHIVDVYLETGVAVGSKVLSERLGLKLSPATIRNVMADLEQLGFLVSPHTSSGRLPSGAGLKFIVNGFLEFRDLPAEDRERLNHECRAHNKSFQELLTQTSMALSGLSSYAGLVLAPKSDRPLRHVEFVLLKPGRALVVLVMAGGHVENRIIEIPANVNAKHLEIATNYLAHQLQGNSLSEIRQMIESDFKQHKDQVDHIVGQLVSKGLTICIDSQKKRDIIIRGQANLLKGVKDLEELERLQSLLVTLDQEEELLKLLNMAINADGVQIFIGSESTLFSHNESSFVVAPYRDQNQEIIGAIGVLGPTYMNYRRIVPMVDYTARLLGRILD